MGMGDITVKVDNTNIAKEAYAAAIDKGLEMIGQQCETYAALLCPVDTGRLQGSITHALSIEGEVHVMNVSANTEYAAYVELGTLYMPARPYMRPAAERHKKEYGAMLEMCLKNA